MGLGALGQAFPAWQRMRQPRKPFVLGGVPLRARAERQEGIVWRSRHMSLSYRRTTSFYAALHRCIDVEMTRRVISQRTSMTPHRMASRIQGALYPVAYEML
jgi:hypothetical protein